MKPDTYAYFDKYGRCVAVADNKFTKPRGGAKAVVDPNTIPDDVWWDGETVRLSEPCTLIIPDKLYQAKGHPFILFLPPGIVAVINGKPSVEQMVLNLDEVGPIYVDIRGAQKGNYVIQVQSYVEARKDEFGAIGQGEQNDALWAGIKAALLGDEEAKAKALAMLEQIETIKAENPKEG